MREESELTPCPQQGCRFAAAKHGCMTMSPEFSIERVYLSSLEASEDYLAAAAAQEAAWKQ